jgi:hypothetical protein
MLAVIFSAVIDQGKLLPTPPCFLHICTTNALTRLPVFQGRAVADADASAYTRFSISASASDKSLGLRLTHLLSDRDFFHLLCSI